MADVFVSYKAEDRRRVEPLVRALESDGLSVWWDAHIGGGDHWRETILDHLESARCVIVVWSRRSVTRSGEFVQDEASRAQRRGTYLPVRIDKVQPPLGFGECQALDLSGWHGDTDDPRYDAVRRAASSRLGAEPAARAAKDTQRSGISRRAVVGGGAVAAAAVAAGGAWFLFKPGAARSESIAVMPFENLSGDPNQAYFSDGIAEELRSALARIAGLKVVARTSSEAVRDDDAKTAARKLDVANILTGSVRRSPALIRISTQLIDGRDGTQLWSEDYDRASGDTLQIQSDIAQRVAAALALRFAPAAGGRLTQGGTTNATAHDLFLQAVAIRQSSHEKDSLTHALAMLDETLAQDPDYADAYAMKAATQAEFTSSFARSGPEMKRGLDAASEIARHALQLAPDLPLAHAALASALAAQLDLSGANAEFQKAVVGNADAVVLGEYAIFLAHIGLTQEAHQLGRRIISIDPLNARSYVYDAAAFYSERKFADCINATLRVLKLHPGAAPALAQLGDSYLNLRKFQEARAAYQQIASDDVFRLTSEGVLDERLGNDAASAEAVRRIERLFGSAASYQLGQLQAQRGKKDEAFAALEMGLRTPDPGLSNLLVDPFLDPLRSDPRFTMIRKKINFPPGIPADRQEG